MASGGGRFCWAVIFAGACGAAVAPPVGAASAGAAEAAQGLAQSHSPAVPALTVRFEGGDVPANAARVLDLLQKLRLVPLETAHLDKGETVCDIYLREMAFPVGCSKDLVRLAGALNHTNYDSRALSIGAPIQYPRVWFTQYNFSRRYDPKSPEDQKGIEDVRQHWSKYIVSSTRLPTGVSKVTLIGYELRVPMTSAADAERTTQALIEAHIPNITFSHPEEQKKLLKSNSVVSPSKYVRDCQAGMLMAGEECAYSLLVGLDKLDWKPCAPKCPDIFLLDRPVRMNPALGKAVMDGWGKDDDPGPPSISPCALPPLKDADHGTHLAGIIGSKGPTCVGLHPDARIHSWNREVDVAVTCDDIESMQDRYDHNGETVGLPIFVFASSWSYEGKAGQTGQHLTKAEDRFNNPFATQIRSHGALWVVAAGQPDPTKGEHAVEITNDLALGPMNLGDERNVLVVTACVDCASDQPALRDPTNYSSTLVHVAAPGDDMPGLAGVRRMAVGGGTSQAAAFVAGVASALVSRYPNVYERPELVKSRLQYTARPVLSPQDSARLASGVIDPAVALLDPSKDYLRKRAGNLDPVRLDGWCAGSFHLTNPDTGRVLANNYEIRTRDILRMYRLNREESGAQPRWIIYTKIAYDPTKPGDVLRVGPAVITVSDGRPGKPTPLVKLTGQGPVPAGIIEDLLVHPSMRTVSCGS